MEKESLKLVLKLPAAVATAVRATSNDEGGSDREFPSGNEDSSSSKAASRASNRNKRKRRRRRFLFTSPSKLTRHRRSGPAAEGDNATEFRSKLRRRDANVEPEVVDLESDPNSKSAFRLPEGGLAKRSRPNSHFSPLQMLLDFYVQLFANKDPEQFFVREFTDDQLREKDGERFFDYAMVKQKVYDGDYSNLMELKADIETVVNNVVKFHSFSVEYRIAARKVIGILDYLFSKEKMLSLQRSVPLLSNVSAEQLGFVAPPKQFNMSPKGKPRLPISQSMIVDDMTPEELLIQAKSIWERVSSDPNRSHIVMPSMNMQKTTTLKCVTPEMMCHGTATDKSDGRPLLLCDVVKDLEEGSPRFLMSSRPPVKAIPVTFLSYGPYASFAPTYDSTCATMNRAESLFYLSALDRQTLNADFSQKKLVPVNSDNCSLNIAERLLTLLRGAKDADHSDAETDQNNKDANQDGSEQQIDHLSLENVKLSSAEYKSLKTLEMFNIDMSFLDSLVDKSDQSEVKSLAKGIADLLEENSECIVTLMKQQNARLSQPPPVSSCKLPETSDAELRASEQLLKNLTSLISETSPAALMAHKEEANNETAKSLTARIEEMSDEECDMNLLREFLQVDT